MQGLRSSVDGLMKLSPFQGIVDQSMLTNKLLGTMNTNVANLVSEIRNISSAPIQQINQEIEKTPQKIGMAEQDVLNLAEKLKEAEAQCRAMGNTTQANKLKEMLKMINAETTDVKGSMQELRQYIEKTFGTDALKQFDKELKNIDNSTKNVGKKSNFGGSLKTALGIGTVALGIRKAYGFFKDATTESVDFVETQNLFNVSMGRTVDQYGNLDKEASKYYSKAVDFQEKLSGKLGINIKESMNYQALFNAMSKSMGISAKYAYTLSENFTKLGYDLSSLYNIDPENAMQKLRAGLSGQTKPLRDLGLDITQQSLEPLLDELGIERSVKQLSQAEKMVARYIVVLRQASLAHGDFAKTMDSPANQLRIFNAQLVAFKRNMGNLWQGLLGNILPYVNAIIMVINELLKMVAKLFGFEVSDQNVNISAGIGADDLADDLGVATDKAKEFKKQLMGFDEINNITLPDKSSSGSGAGVGGIDQKLLDAMKEYDNMMDKVKSKATDIKNQIMKWLGFTGDTEKDLAKMKEWLDKIKKVATLILALYIGTKLLKLIGYLKTLGGVLTGTITPTTSFQNGLALVGTGLKNTGTWLKIGAEQFKTYIKSGEGVGTALAKTGQGMLDLIPKTVRVAGGIAGLVVSCGLAYSSMQDLSNGSIGTGEAIAKLTGSIAGATASGAMLGSVFGPVGTAVGALTGLILSAGSAMLGYNNNLQANAEAIENLKKKNEQLIASHEATIEAINKNKDSQLINLQVAKEQIDSMKDMIDSNGKVKDSYKSRVEYILNDVNKALGTEFTLTGNQITQNGKVVKSYDDLVKKTDEYIRKKEEQIYLEAYEEAYKAELKQQLELQKQLKEAEEETAKAQEERNKFIEEGSKKLVQYRSGIDGIQTARAEMNYNNAIEQENKIREELEKTGKSIETAKKDWTKYYDDISDTSKDKSKEINETTIRTLTQQTKTVEDLTPKSIEAWKDLASKSATEYEQQLLQTDETTQIVLDAITGNINISSPNFIEKWRKMASDSKEKYDEALSKLPENTRLLIETLTNTTSTLSPNQIQKWADLARNDKQAYENNLKGMDTTTSQRVQSCVDAVNNKKWSAEEASKGLARAVERGTNTIDTTDAGKQAVNGVATGIEKNKNNRNIWNAIFNLKNVVTGGLQSVLGIHSPSTVMRDMVGKFIPLGIAEGIDNNANAVFSSIKDLNNGITKGFSINPNDFKIDTNQFIDYGQISGAIATQSNVEVSSSLPQQVKEAVIEGMRNSKIKVEVEGKANKDAIFKIVQAGAEEYTMQTGESAFSF